MASAWGKSWGGAFGVAFGAALLVTPAPVQMGGGGTLSYRAPTEQQLETDLQQQIAQEDEIIILAVAQLIVQGAFT